MAAERIICLQIGSHLRDCPLMKNSGHCILDCGCDQLEGVKCNKGLPRTEAIERMAKVEWMTTVCLRNNIFEDKITKEKWEEEWKKLKRSYKDIYLKSAEAALDGLLEVSINE